MHQLLEGAGHKILASPFPWLKDEVEILRAAGFHDIKVHTYVRHISSPSHHDTPARPRTVLASTEVQLKFLMHRWRELLNTCLEKLSR